MAEIGIFIAGALLAWFIALRFYKRSSKDLKKEAADLKKEASELRKDNKLILRGLENAGFIKLDRDEKGNILHLDRIVREVAVGIDAILVRESKSEEQNGKT
jgi:hypothetical protein